MFLLVAGVLVAVAISAFWLERVAFSPSSDDSVAAAVLDNDDIRNELATLIASNDAPVLEVSSTQLKEFIEQIALLDAGAALMSDVVEKAHATVIGERIRPVRVTPAEQVQIVRDERVANESGIVVPVQEVTVLSALNSSIGWVWKVSAGLGGLLFLVGLILRPEPGERTLALSLSLLALGLLFPFFGWFVPFAILPNVSDDTWTAVFAELANDRLFVTILVSVLSLVGAALVFMRTTGSRQRRQSSTPLSMGRYREQQHWSR
jgi:hypothetical protein